MNQNISLRPELGAKITKIAHKYNSEGIRIDSIDYFFHKEFLEELDLKKEGFESMDQLISSLLLNKYPIEIRNDCEGFQRLYSYQNQYFYWLSVIKIEKNFQLMQIMADIPEDVTPCGQQLPDFEFSKCIEFNELPEILSGDIINGLKFTEVKIMSAKSPHELYLHICGEEYHNSYHSLRQEMRFYDKTENSKKYRIPRLLLYEGLLCAVRYETICNEWHRSRVVSIDDNNVVKLDLIDIGETIESNSSHLCLLLKKFAQLPPQALRVQLTAVRPLGKTGQKWSQWAKNLVKKLEYYNHCGKIECAFIDHQNDRFRGFVRYYDRYRSKDTNDLLFLHKILVDKQLAIISSFDKPID